MTSSSPPQKVSLYNLAELKTTLDDSLPDVLTQLPPPYRFTQSHQLVNVRLALGYSAVLIAGVLFYFDWKFGWDATKPYTLPACIAYFILNGALTWWGWQVEGGKVFVGTREGGQTLTLASSVKKHDPTYNLSITYTAPSGKPFPLPQDNISAPMAELFNMHGFLDRKALKRWLAGNIEVVGLADPEAKREWDERNKIEEAEEEIISAGAARSMDAGTGTGTGTPRNRSRKT